ncbi:MAG: Alpha-D-glucose 1-phosphate phosphatase YihX [Pseudomonas citronellolis]|nr:MAG: Alpha-D-glucose 1-phosphate phosphatase YihX [Pseudomonas citronellolis]
MPHMTPTAVVFDLGNVLIDWNPRYLYRQLFDGDEAAMEYFLAEVCHSAWNEEQDAGRSFADGIAEAIGRHPHEAERIRAYYTRWEETLGGPMADTLAILEELRGGEQRLLALTNWSAETFPVALQRYEFLSWFEDIVVSGREKLKKPDPAIFQLLLQRAALEPAATVFIDDSPRNVAAARALGIQALHFTSAAQLRQDLRELGVALRA